ncbi:DnaJ protein, putative [Plasmodium berghei]|uniref:DnaJ protein, putative n=2 Tax=Plasmodium berghei TaxID=5821 RepID=A0A509ARE4_PLABA|nr:DnaJ protein, putative [Plasmodium berghei ANKA]CXI54846.1 DnaJ protein, putative [Plasmodium berghei]SCL95055.1 DnaJ protein, putative [Plasmodium berghei]SCM16163.1 DnaJ protein, putative [Plasmodium berghei]SCM17959.1 DnaJ protein, putative [Plasmodium berghei]SCN26339.1 DnaJ protein, putative [Plasmodium berghei]|eukprot:XP_034422087.1 DnaJ protein, putative [Plasmodium berghei ANKA]
MEDIIIYMLIIAPLTRWIIGPNRPWNKGKREYGVFIALFILFCVAAYELQKPEQNAYEILNVNTHVSTSEIRQSFRKLSRKYHPDKNKEPDAFDKFNKIREAYEILSNDKKKYNYDRFGDFQGSDITSFFYVEIIIIAIFQFAISFIFGFLYTYGRDNEKYRVLICLYISLNFCLELILRFSNESTEFLAFWPLFNRYTPFERIKAIKALVPLFMNVILFVDIYLIEDDISVYALTFCEYILKKNLKILKNYNDAVLFCAKLVDGKLDRYSNFSWRPKEEYTYIENVQELNDDQTYDKKCDKNDIFYKLLHAIVETNKENVDLQIPKKELCRRFDWSQSYISSILSKNEQEKDIEEGNANKGVMFSAILYIIGIVSHLLSK